MKKITLGMIGYNDGNGHPYSFSAIINGYNETAFPDCPYPVINDYLKARKKEEFGVGSFQVTHVWTPYPEITNNIAAYANIKNICAKYQDMIGNTDAVIIARDDAESHREIAMPFLNAGTKVFLDKPLCKTEDDLKFFKPYLLKGQLMSCSGLRFYPDIQTRFNGTLDVNDILYIHCVAPLDWFKYGVHVFEGVVPLVGSDVEWVQNIGEAGNDIVRIQMKSGKYLLINVTNGVGGGLRCTIWLKGKAPVFVHYNDNFSCFKQQLVHFFDFVSKGTMAVQPDETLRIITSLIAADQSRKDHQRIQIDL